MYRTQRGRRAVSGRFVAASLLLLPLSLGALLVPQSALAANVLHVDKKNSHCSDSGNGTASAPYCTIQAAVNKANPGTTVLVESGIYSEKVSVNVSGTSTAPIVIQAAGGANVTVTSPGNGFALNNVNWVTLDGFIIADSIGYGVLASGCNHVTVSNNHVSGSGKKTAGNTRYAILVRDTTNSTISNNITDHNSDAGVALTKSTTAVRVTGNVSFSNARGYQSAAPGIDIRANGNTIDRNTTYSNEDSGIQLYNGATGDVVIDNLSYGNGDHGIDVLTAPNAVVVSNTAYGNFTSGITLETGSSGATVANNVLMDNGVTKRGNVWVDASSSPGTVLDDDLVYQSGAGSAFFWNGVRYNTRSAFNTATGQEARGLQADPKFVSVGTSDFHLLAGSPAIDSADSAAPSQPTTDREDQARIDDPSVSNTGVGSRAYDDRGAFEYQPGGVDAPPVAHLTVTPNSGAAPLPVTADASASTDTDSTPIATYTFDFGDGTVIGPQAGATAPHTYSSTGPFTVTVTVTDTAALSSQATAPVTVGGGTTEFVTNPGFETDTSGWAPGGASITLSRVKAGHLGSWKAKLANPTTTKTACLLNDQPNWVTHSAAGTYTASLWVKAVTAGRPLTLALAEVHHGVKLGGNSTKVTLTTAWQKVTVTYSAASPGSSTISFSAKVPKAPKGTCFFADDASISLG
ncbi:MAG: hypothetical protein QOI81_2053 [Actinomycetota bacterium]|nr:hypothetical protein [Actinomycetota bacterium]